MNINGKNLNTTWIVIAAVALILFFWAFSAYNSLVPLDEQVTAQWANVEAAYQRRADLIPNLVNTVKGYASHESGTLEAVTAARAGLQDAYNAANSATADDTSEASIEEYRQKQQQLSSALGIYVNAVHEAYPTLTAGENFLGLQAQLEGTENRIETERIKYNEAVQEYNNKVRRFPANILAGIFGFERRTPFKADDNAKNAPKVEF